MAYHIIKLVLSRLAYNLGLELCPVNDDSLDQQSVFT